MLGYHWGRQDDEIRQRLGISLQETRLSEKLTVLETLTLFRSFYRQGIEPEEAMARVSLGREGRRRGSRVFQAGRSSGWRWPVHWWAIRSCCVSTSRPPGSIHNRDGRSGRSSASFRQGGRTVLLTTHYMDEAERLCDRVAIVDDGRVIALGTPQELIATLGGDHVIEFTWEGNGIERRIDPAEFATLPGSQRSAASTRIACHSRFANRTWRCRQCSKNSRPLTCS